MQLYGLVAVTEQGVGGVPAGALPALSCRLSLSCSCMSEAEPHQHSTSEGRTHLSRILGHLPRHRCFIHGNTPILDMVPTRVCQRTARKAVQHITWRSYSIVHDVPRTSAAIPHTAPPTPSPSSVFDAAVNASAARNTWTKEEISEIYKTPLMDLAYAAVGQPVKAGRGQN